MSADLETRFGPTALVIGASDGIGSARAEVLTEQSLDLVRVARREGVLEGIARDLRGKHGTRVTVIGADLSAPGAVAGIMERTAATSTGLLAATAGFGSIGPFLDLDAVTAANTVDLNCRSVVELTHGLATRMAALGRGGVVLFRSVVGFSGGLRPRLPLRRRQTPVPVLRRPACFPASPRLYMVRRGETWAGCH